MRLGLVFLLGFFCFSFIPLRLQFSVSHKEQDRMVSKSDATYLRAMFLLNPFIWSQSEDRSPYWYRASNEEIHCDRTHKMFVPFKEMENRKIELFLVLTAHIIKIRSPLMLRTSWMNKQTTKRRYSDPRCSWIWSFHVCSPRCFHAFIHWGCSHTYHKTSQHHKKKNTNTILKSPTFILKAWCP